MVNRTNRTQLKILTQGGGDKVANSNKTEQETLGNILQNKTRQPQSNRNPNRNISPKYRA